jgi:hypothetical protein
MFEQPTMNETRAAIIAAEAVQEIVRALPPVPYVRLKDLHYLVLGVIERAVLRGMEEVAKVHAQIEE